MQDLAPLSLADNVESLEILARKDAINNAKPEILHSSCKKLAKEIFKDTNNQEKCFILAVRYLYIIDRLYRISDDKKYIEVYSGKEWDRVKELAERLRITLTERYRKRAEELLQKKDKIKADQAKTMLQKPKSPAPVFEGEYITCENLYRTIQDNKINVLIVDIRPEEDFNASKIKYSNVINIPEDVIIPGLSANVLGTKLKDNSTRQTWDKRDSFQVLVILDWDSDKDSFYYSKLYRLKNMVVEWDFNRKYLQHPVFLSGGFREFVEMYPTLVTNCHVYLVRKNEEIDELLELDSITYPDASINTLQLKQFKISTLEETTKNDTLNEIEDVNLKNFIPVQPKEEIEATIKGGEEKQDPQKPEEDDESISEEEIRRDIENRRLRLLQEARKVKPEINFNELFPEGSDGDVPEPDNRYIIPPPVRRDTKPQDLVTDSGWCGLINIRNTCYLNTVLQCLKCLPIIKRIFVRSDYLKLTTRPPVLMIEFANTIKALWKGNEYDRKVFRPNDFYEKVCKLEPTYHKGNHEDCMEFFLFLFNQLHEDCSVDIRRPAVMIEKEKSWFAQLQGRTSPWVDLFYHQFKCTKICKVCKLQAVSYETDNTLMLPVPSNYNNRSIHLKDLIDEYMEDNHIVDYKCSRCRKMQVINTKSVVEAPEVLVIVLKRYFQDEYQYTRKNNAPVDFDLRFNFGGWEYKLYSVAQHRGTMEHGHYFAQGLVMEQNKDVWIEFNDERTTKFVGNENNAMSINHDVNIKCSACAFFYYKQEV